MSDVFEILKQDHTEVQEMLAKLTATGPQGAEHVALAERLVIEESKHEAAEEMHFWPSVRQHVPDGDALADRAILQEREGKEMLDALRKTAPEDRRFEELIVTFAKAGRAHIAFEEEQVWPKLRQALSPSEQAELGNKIGSAKDSGPTRPHPYAPDSPGALKTAGVATALADKARDAATGRGR
jgi:hemerythrin superfamily protein